MTDQWDTFHEYAKSRGWDTADGAAGQCSHAAKAFVDWLGEGQIVGLTGAPTGWSNHAVARLPDGRHVDWTRRQFDPHADFPYVTDVIIEWDTETVLYADGRVDMESIVGTPEEWEADW